MKVPISHCVIAWLTEHAGWLLTVRRSQSDGLTPYQRLRGRHFALLMLGFGKCCHSSSSAPCSSKASARGNCCAPTGP